MSFEKKCKTCANSDPNFIEGLLYCKENLCPCVECFMDCSDKRMNCQLCDKYDKTSKKCIIDGKYKSGNAWRICKLRG